MYHFPRLSIQAITPYNAPKRYTKNEERSERVRGIELSEVALFTAIAGAVVLVELLAEKAILELGRMYQRAQPLRSSRHSKRDRVGQLTGRKCGPLSSA